MLPLLGLILTIALFHNRSAHSAALRQVNPTASLVGLSSETQSEVHAVVATPQPALHKELADVSQFELEPQPSVGPLASEDPIDNDGPADVYLSIDGNSISGADQGIGFLDHSHEPEMSGPPSNIESTNSAAQDPLEVAMQTFTPGSVEGSLDEAVNEDELNSLEPELPSPESAGPILVATSSGTDSQTVIVLQGEQVVVFENGSPFVAPEASPEPVLVASLDSPRPSSTPSSFISPAVLEGDSLPGKDEQDPLSGIGADDLDSLLMPSSLASLTPPEPIKSAAPSVEASGDEFVSVLIPLKIDGLSDDFGTIADHSIREYFAGRTGSTTRDWELVHRSNEDSELTRRQFANTWYVTYLGQLRSKDADENVAVLEENISGGSLDQHLHDATGEGSIVVRMAGAPTLDVDNVTENTVGNSQDAIGDSNASEAVTEDAADESADEGSSVNKHSDSKGQRKGQHVGVIVGSSLGGLALLVIALAGVVQCRKRQHPNDHLIDGIAAVPSTIPSIASSDDDSSRFETGAPVNPRGPQVLREQSRILDWQMNHAQVANNLNRSPGDTSFSQLSIDASSLQHTDLSVLETVETENTVLSSVRPIE